jgi:hypothetical protein
VPITARPVILEFFDPYQRGADTSDPDLVRDCFAETFLNLDPRRAGPVLREALLQALPSRAQLFTSIRVEAVEWTDLAAVVAERTSAGRSDEGARSDRLGTPAGDQPPQR